MRVADGELVTRVESVIHLDIPLVAIGVVLSSKLSAYQAVSWARPPVHCHIQAIASSEIIR